VGCTVNVPFIGTAVPFRLPLTAFLEVQVRVEDCPAAMEVGLAAIPAATDPEVAGADAATVTVTAFEAVAPAADVAANV
jgi:hypothetical protein